MTTTPVDAKINTSMNKNLNVGIEDINSDSLVLEFFTNAESGIYNRVITIKTIIVIAPQKNATTSASFVLISLFSATFFN